MGFGAFTSCLLVSFALLPGSRVQCNAIFSAVKHQCYISSFLPPEAPTFVIYRTSISLSCRKKATSHARRQHVRVDIKSVTQSTINLFVHLTHISACTAEQEWD